MTFKQFEKWCSDRVTDGCWGIEDAVYCIELLKMLKRIPFWRRKKVWNNIKDKVVFAVVGPINRKIQEIRSADHGDPKAAADV